MLRPRTSHACFSFEFFSSTELLVISALALIQREAECKVISV